MKLFLTLLLIFFSVELFSQHQYFYKGTTIIFTEWKDTIFLGADSKMALADNKQNGDITFQPYCKIQHVNNIFFAVAGIYGMPDSSYFAPDIIRLEILRGGSFKEINKRIHNIIYRKLNEAITNGQIKNDSLLHANQKSIVSILITGFINNKPLLDISYYPLINGKVKVKVDTNEIHKVTPTILTLGKQDSINALMDGGSINYSKINSTPTLNVAGFPNFKILGMPDLVYYLLYVESIKSKKDVGLPISIIQLTKNGYKWILNELNCK